MADQVWYYARGDVEKGPVTGAQIKALTGAGKIRQDDFVWKEGMDTWVPAGELKELFPGDGASDQLEGEPLKQNTRQLASKVRPALAVQRRSEPEKMVRPIGQLSLVIGLLVVLLARGCDTLSARHAARLEAIAEVSVEIFAEEGWRRREPIEQQLRALQEKPSLSAADQQQLNKLNGQVKQLEADLARERGALEDGTWRQLRSAANEAQTDHLLFGFWREAAFVLGTVILAIGLLAAAISGDAAERWICLAMLGAIVFSVYLGGAAFAP